MWAASHMFIVLSSNRKVWQVPHLFHLDILETQGGQPGPIEGLDGNIVHS